MDDGSLIEELNKRFNGLASDEVDELVVRVSQYAITGGVQTTSQWQAIVRFRNRTKPWGVAVARTPGDAVLGAFRAAYALTPAKGAPPLTGPLTPRTRTRTRITS